ncbi:MAG: Calx-beta domain-containing protein [Geminicoccaceae bacterium]
MRLRNLAIPALLIAGLGTGVQADQRYTVQRGDTLSELAKRFYGHLEGWRLIYRANRDQVFDGGDLVATGVVLVIPDAPEGSVWWNRSGSDDLATSLGKDSRIPMARPTTLLLHSGQAFIGSIVGATADSILIRRGVRTFRVDIDHLKEARIESRDGGVIAGKLLGWDNGIFDIHANDYRLAVKQGQIISVARLSEARGSSAAEKISTRDVEIADTPVIRLRNGKQLAGYIVDIDDRFVTVRRGARGSNRIKLTDITDLQIATPEGDVVAGQLVDWTDGTYRLQSGERSIIARENIVPADPAPTLVADAEQPPAPVAEAPKTETAAAHSDDENTPEIRVRTLPRRSSNTGRTGTKQADADVAVAEGTTSDQSEDNVDLNGEFIPIAELVPDDTEVITVQVAALPASEGDEAMRFEVNLSRAPSEQLVIVYASVDGTAKSGQDYEKRSGVQIFEPGQTSLSVDIPLIDDSKVEQDETIHLFISPDPSRAKVQNRDSSGIVRDDDA